MYKQNIFARPFVAKLKRGDTEIEAVLWAESEKELRERLKTELSQEIVLVSVKERE